MQTFVTRPGLTMNDIVQQHRPRNALIGSHRRVRVRPCKKAANPVGVPCTVVATETEVHAVDHCSCSPSLRFPTARVHAATTTADRSVTPGRSWQSSWRTAPLVGGMQQRPPLAHRCRERGPSTPSRWLHPSATTFTEPTNKPRPKLSNGNALPRPLAWLRENRNRGTMGSSVACPRNQIPRPGFQWGSTKRRDAAICPDALRRRRAVQRRQAVACGAGRPSARRLHHQPIGAGRRRKPRSERPVPRRPGAR